MTRSERETSPGTLVGELLAADEDISGPAAEEWYGRLDERGPELHDGLSELCRRSPEQALRVVAAVWPYWIARGRLAEARAWLDDVLGRPGAHGRTSQRARALTGFGVVAFLQGDAAAARVSLGESLLLARELGDPTVEADSLIGLARVGMLERDSQTMERCAREAADVALGNRDERRYATALHHVAEALRRQGRFTESLPLYRDAIARHRALGDRRSVALELHNLGRAARQTGDLEPARECCQKSLRAAVELKHDRLVGYCLFDLAGMAVDDGDAARAAQLVGGADALFERVGAALEPEYADERRRVLGLTTRALGADRSRTEYEAGTSAGLEHLVERELERI